METKMHSSHNWGSSVIYIASGAKAYRRFATGCHSKGMANCEYHGLSSVKKCKDQIQTGRNPGIIRFKVLPHGVSLWLLHTRVLG